MIESSMVLSLLQSDTIFLLKSCSIMNRVWFLFSKTFLKVFSMTGSWQPNRWFIHYRPCYSQLVTICLILLYQMILSQQRVIFCWESDLSPIYLIFQVVRYLWQEDPVYLWSKGKYLYIWNFYLELHHQWCLEQWYWLWSILFDKDNPVFCPKYLLDLD